MEYIVEWIKQIAFFYVISGVVCVLVPNQKFKKYIRLFTGFVMIILILKPVGKIFNIDEEYKKNIEIGEKYQMSNELKKKLSMASASRQNLLLGEYENVIKADIKEYLENENMNLRNFDMTVTNEGNIDTITLDVEDTINQPGNLLILKIKKYLSDVYNLNERNIYVNITG